MTDLAGYDEWKTRSDRDEEGEGMTAIEKQLWQIGAQMNVLARQRDEALAALATAEAENAGYVEQLELRDKRLEVAEGLLEEYRKDHDNDPDRIHGSSDEVCDCTPCLKTRAYLAERSKGSDPLREAVEYVERHHPLPRCAHGSALRDHSGEQLVPPCGCLEKRP